MWTLALSMAVVLPLQALPRPEDPIDASKRAPITTKGAVRPAATPSKGTGVVGKGRIAITPAAVSASRTPTPTAPIAVSEARPKPVRPKRLRNAPEPRAVVSTPASSLPASVPRLEAGRYQKMLAHYRGGRRSAADMRQVASGRTQERVSLADVNRFASPRAALERQGIPVVPAGGEPPPPPAETVPVRTDTASPAP